MEGKRGISLIEIITVISILTLILSLSLIVSIDSFRGYSFRDERDKIIGLLQKARSQAINNICLDTSCDDGIPHGVFISNNTLTLFEGENWINRHALLDETIEINKTISITGISEVVFSQLSGDATTTPKTVSTITLSDITSHNSVITISTEGNISWTN